MADAEGKAFISYSREDLAFALRLAGDLKAAGAKVWLDKQDIQPGEDWDQAVEDALNHAPQIVLILSPASSKSRNVRNEISFALDAGKLIIPILYRDCTIPVQVHNSQYIDFRGAYPAALEELQRRFGVEPRPPAPSRSRVWAKPAVALCLILLPALYWEFRPAPAGKPAPPGAGAPRRLQGIVLAEDTRKPIAGVVTTVIGGPAGESAVSDESGRFDIPLHSQVAQSEMLRIRAEKTGYEIRDQEMNLSGATVRLKPSNVPRGGPDPSSQQDRANLRLQIQQVSQAVPLISKEQPRFNGEPVLCDTATLYLVVAHDHAGTVPLTVHDIALKAELVPGGISPPVDCAIDTLASKPHGIVDRDTYHFEIADGRPSGRYIKSASPGDASPVDPNNILHVGERKHSITLKPEEEALGYDVAIEARTPGLYRVWFTANYDASGPRSIKTKSFLLAK